MSWKPSKKFYAAAVTGAASIVGSWIATGSFDATERGMAATLIVSLAGLYAKSS